MKDKHDISGSFYCKFPVCQESPLISLCPFGVVFGRVTALMEEGGDGEF